MALERSERSIPRSGRFTPGNIRYPSYGGWLGPRADLDVCGKSRPHRDSIPGSSSPKRVAIPTELSWSAHTHCTNINTRNIIWRQLLHLYLIGILQLRTTLVSFSYSMLRFLKVSLHRNVQNKRITVFIKEKFSVNKLSCFNPYSLYARFYV